uniref:Uncharacterized protein n=1 Tax=Arundo donax TaxID=35708 RepID=A0A0A9QK49_ARUDO
MFPYSGACFRKCQIPADAFAVFNSTFTNSVDLSSSDKCSLGDKYCNAC